ncbi:lipopolysaccharide biosynthesis protein [Marinobacter fonticola]|uniref:lipopolysaccharide biosynthesis protein n=1 Tax=Marinobacter fonticola TaxID=2603215 RepID=UPI0011E83FAC|nr:lipopolysaccharide biosynthesis protein [Marinobacter fonticola]
MDLKKRLSYSTAWMSLGATGTSVVSFIIFIIISRLLTPAEIGLVAFSLIFIDFGKLVAQGAIGKAIVQHSSWNDDFASTCFYLNLVFAVLLSLLFLAVGVPLVSTYYEPAAGPILQALTAIFLLEGIKTVYEGKLQREFAFRVIAIRTMVSSLVSGAVGVFLAVRGYGVWALVWQQLINNLLLMLITVIWARWRPRFRFSRTACRKIFQFASPILGAQVLGAASAKIFELFVGIFLGPAALGFFKVGGRAIYILQDIVLKPFEHTLLSALSRLPGPEEQARGTLRVIRISAYITFPIFFGAAAIAPDFIVFAFGSKWEASGNIMAIIALGIPPFVVGTQLKGILMAGGHSRVFFMVALGMLLANGVLGLVSVPMGLLMAACGFSLRNYISMVFYLRAFRRLYNVPALSVVKTVSPAFVASVIMCLCVFTMGGLFHEDAPGAIKLLALCTAGAGLYLVLMITVCRRETGHFFEEGMDILPHKMQPLAQAIQRFIRV